MAAQVIHLLHCAQLLAYRTSAEHGQGRVLGEQGGQGRVMAKLPTLKPRISKYDALKPHRHLYASARWKAIRAAQLDAHPLCIMCEQAGRIVTANVCDHITPHRGDETLFYAGPFQSLCATHHSGSKQREEARGYEIGCDVEGNPIDAGHRWNKGK